MKRIKLVLLILLALIMCSACAIQTGSFEDRSDKALSQARKLYRSAQLVVRGTCVQSYMDAYGTECAEIRVSEVLAGDASVGDTIHCATSSLKNRQSYLLYLHTGDDVHYSEDERVYNVIDDGLVKLEGANAVIDGLRVALSDVKKDMRDLGSVISSPSDIWYYSTIEELVVGADDIFIGRINAVGQPENVSFKSTASGSTVENTLPASFLDVMVYGSLKGSLNYGDEVKLVYSPEMNADLVNAATLKAEPYKDSDSPTVETGATCIFFISRSPDAKQEYCFPVNPVQGFITLEGDALYPVRANRAAAGFDSLTKLVVAIQAVL